jgi:hypothetical protein
MNPDISDAYHGGCMADVYDVSMDVSMDRDDTHRQESFHGSENEYKHSMSGEH